MTFEIDQPETDKVDDLERLIQTIDKAKKELKDVLKHDHPRIHKIRLEKSTQWLEYARSAAWDTQDTAKRFG